MTQASCGAGIRSPRRSRKQRGSGKTRQVDQHEPVGQHLVLQEGSNEVVHIEADQNGLGKAQSSAERVSNSACVLHTVRLSDTHPARTPSASALQYGRLPKP